MISHAVSHLRTSIRGKDRPSTRGIQFGALRGTRDQTSLGELSSNHLSRCARRTSPRSTVRTINPDRASCGQATDADADHRYVSLWSTTCPTTLWSTPLPRLRKCWLFLEAPSIDCYQMASWNQFECVAARGSASAPWSATWTACNDSVERNW
jgi:hypothetical protein